MLLCREHNSRRNKNLNRYHIGFYCRPNFASLCSIFTLRVGITYVYYESLVPAIAAVFIYQPIYKLWTCVRSYMKFFTPINKWRAMCMKLTFIWYMPKLHKFRIVFQWLIYWVLFMNCKIPYSCFGCTYLCRSVKETVTIKIAFIVSPVVVCCAVAFIKFEYVCVVIWSVLRLFVIFNPIYCVENRCCKLGIHFGC